MQLMARLWGCFSLYCVIEWRYNPFKYVIGHLFPLFPVLFRNHKGNLLKEHNFQISFYLLGLMKWSKWC